MKRVQLLPEESINYDVFADGEKVRVYDAQVQLDTTNVTKHIYRPEHVSYICAELEKDTEITVIPKYTNHISDIKIQPESKKINFESDGRRIRIKISPGQKFCITVNGEQNKMLMVFANKPVPVPKGDDVVYIGPGEYLVDENEDNIMYLNSGQTLYLASGAVLHGKIRAVNARDVSVIGNGIICGTYNNGRWRDEIRDKVGVTNTVSRGNQILIENCENVKFQSFCLIDSDGWNLQMSDSNNIEVDEINIISYQMNSDGIDICSSCSVDVSGVFIRTSDDGIVLKTMQGHGECSNVNVSGCTIWADRASALEIGHEIAGGDIYKVRYRDIDILNQLEDTIGYHAIDIANVDDGAVYDVSYENIRVEDCVRGIGLRIREGIFSNVAFEKTGGRIHDIKFKDIHFNGEKSIILSGRDENFKIKNITFENIFMGNRKLLDPSYLRYNPYVEDVEIIDDGKIISKLEGYPTDKEDYITLDIRMMCNLLIEENWGIYELEDIDWITLPSGVNEWEGVPFDITGQGHHPKGDYKLLAVPENRLSYPLPARMNTSINAKWLFFLHTGVNCIGDADKVLGKYVITYEDGTTEEIEIKNKNDCDNWHTWSTGGWQPVYNGIKMYIMPWKNPKLDETINSIELKDGEIHAMPVLIAITYVEQ